MISVLTPTYNRAHLLHRNYQSLLNCSYKNFEWIILDDGSTDNTKELVAYLTRQANFPIRYYYQPNRGKHVALNRLYDLAKGTYCFQLDSDDEILPDAMEKGLAIWEQLKNPEKYWAVCGRCLDQNARPLSPNKFPGNINELSRRAQRKVLQNFKEERWSLQKTSIVKGFKFPEKVGIPYISESYLWKQIAHSYKQWYTNDFFRVYYTKQKSVQSLSNIPTTKADYEIKASIKLLFINKFISGKYAKMYTLKEKVRMIVAYSCFSIKAGKKVNNCVSGIHSSGIKAVVFLLVIPLKMVNKLHPFIS